jgi:hypothetical protein
MHAYQIEQQERKSVRTKKVTREQAKTPYLRQYLLLEDCADCADTFAFLLFYLVTVYLGII